MIVELHEYGLQKLKIYEMEAELPPLSPLSLSYIEIKK